MPLRCVDDEDRSIEACNFDDEGWKALRAQNRAQRHLRMPCCGAEVVLRKSNRGTRHFAHKTNGECEWKPESEVHRYLKELARNSARHAGWKAETEVSGRTPDGEQWTADVLASRDDYKVAVEIQWSGQTNEETLRRQARYRRSRVRGLWLLRQRSFPISKELPAARVGGALQHGLKILVPKCAGDTARRKTINRDWTQSHEPEEFFKAVFERRFRYGTEHVNAVTLSIVTDDFNCVQCRSLTQIVTGFKGRAGNVELRYTLKHARANPELGRALQNAVKDRENIGPLRERYNRFDEKTYLINTCARCNAGIGRIFDGTENFREGKIIGEIEWTLDAETKATLADKAQHWHVWEEQPRPS